MATAAKSNAETVPAHIHLFFVIGFLEKTQPESITKREVRELGSRFCQKENGAAYSLPRFC